MTTMLRALLQRRAAFTRQLHGRFESPRRGRQGRLAVFLCTALVAGTGYYAYYTFYSSTHRVIAMIDQLTKVCDTVNTELSDLQNHAKSDAQFSGKSVSRPDVIVYPQSTAEVAEIVKIAQRFKAPVIAVSGSTSIEGQCTFTRGGISIDFSLMNQILSINTDDMDVVVQPGVDWQTLNSVLQEQDTALMFGVDPGPGAQFGGMISTSGSGTNAVRYGTMKENVINLTVVLADGSITKTRSRSKKSASGYDLTRLFIGAEGTLGVITEATLKLVPVPSFERVGVCSFDSPFTVANVTRQILRSGIQARCLELLDTSTMKVINETSGMPPFAERPHLFFKLSGTEQSVKDDKKRLTAIVKGAKGQGLRIADSVAEGEAIWTLRKSILYSLLNKYPGSEFLSTDVAVPMSRLADLIQAYNVKAEKTGLANAVLG